MSNYEIRVYDTSGVLTAVFDDWNSLNYKKRLNNYGTHQISMLDIDNIEQDFIKDAIVVVRRKTDRNDWYTDYAGLHRSPRHQITENGIPLFTSYGRSLVDLLNRPIAFYYPNFPGTAGESAMKQLVDLNAGPNNTHGSQKIQTIPPDLAQGGLWGGQRNQPRLLDALQEISRATGVDFDVGVSFVGGIAFQFTTYYPQRGADLTNNLGPKLGPAFGNVKLPDYTKSGTEEINTLTVYDPNTGSTVVQDLVSASESPWNDIEGLLTTDQGTPAARQFVGEAELLKLAAQDHFTFEVLQTEGCEYGLDYNFGDLVTVNFGPYSIDRKIVGIDITVADGRETIKIDVSAYAPKPTWNDIIRGLAGRIKRVEEQL